MSTVLSHTSGTVHVGGVIRPEGSVTIQHIVVPYSPVMRQSKGAPGQKQQRNSLPRNYPRNQTRRKFIQQTALHLPHIWP